MTDPRPPRIAVLSDLHINLGLRWREGQRVHTWIAAALGARAARGTGPDLVVVAGDVYERSPIPEEVMEAIRFLRLLAATAPVVVLRGNHDPRHAIDVFAHLATPHPITVYDQPAVHPFSGGALAVLPWLDRVGPPPERRATKEQRAVERGTALRALLVDLGDKLRQHDGLRLFAGHCAVGGAKTSAGQPLKKGQEFEVSLADLEAVGAAGYLLGHVHLPQGWAIGDAPVLYTGSTHRVAFGEMETKQVVLISGRRDARGVDVEGIETPTAPMLLLRTGWTGSGWETPVADLVDAVEGAMAVAPAGIPAEVRLLYRVAPEHREAARFAAAEVKATLETLGALVTTRPELVVEKTARCPEIAQAGALTDKLGLFLEEVRDIHPTDPRAVRAQEALAELETALALKKAPQTGGVRLRRLRFAGLGVFKEETELDLDEIPGPIIAVVGENGHGKSTLCGAFGAAMDRKVATDHGVYPVGHYVTLPDGFLETVVDVGGEPYRLYQAFGEDKAFVYRPDGTPVDERGMRSSFDRWAADHLLPREVRQASLVAVQAEDGIVKARRGKRKSLLLQAMGAGAVTKVGEVAAQRAKRETEALGRIARALTDREEARRTYPDHLVVQIEEARAKLAQAEREHVACRHALDAHQAEVAARRETIEARHAHAEATRRLDHLRTQCAQAEATLAEGPAIQEAVDEMARIDKEIAAARARAGDARTVAARFTQEATRARTAMQEADDRARGHRQAHHRAETTLGQRETVAASEAALPGHHAAVATAEANVLAAEEAARVARVEDERILRRVGDADRAGKEAGAARARAATHRAAEHRALAVLADRERVANAGAALAGHRALVAEQEHVFAAAEAEVARIREQTAHAGERRILALRQTLAAMPALSTLAAAQALARAALADDDTMVHVTGGEALAQALGRLSDARGHLETARTALAASSSFAAQAPAMVRAEEDRVAALTALAAEEAAAERAAGEETAIRRDVEAARAMASHATTDALAALRTVRTVLAGARAALQDAQALAAQAPLVDRAGEDLAAAAAAIAVEETAIARATTEEGAAQTAVQTALGEAQGEDAAVERWAARRAPLLPTTARAADLDRAEGSLVALAPTITAAEEAVARVAWAMALPLPPEMGRAPDVNIAALNERSYATVLATLEEKARAVAIIAEQIAALEVELAAARTTVATWELVAQAFGPDGIPALEIDAACPALSELATGYLHKHFGSRWSMRIDTREEDEDGEETGAGALNITVYDAEEGRKGDILFFSPGERAFLGRAFAGALAFLVCSRIGATEPTLVLDETAGAVSPGNLDAYMGMIRGIASDIGAHRVLLVVQSPPLAALADSVIVVNKGTITVTNPDA